MSHVFPRCLLAKGCPNRLQQPIHLQLNVSQDCLRLINVKIRLVTQGREETKTDMVTSKNASIAGGTKTAWRRILGIFCLNDETCSWVVMCWKQDKNFAAVFFFFCLFVWCVFVFVFFFFVCFLFLFLFWSTDEGWMSAKNSAKNRKLTWDTWVDNPRIANSTVYSHARMHRFCMPLEMKIVIGQTPFIKKLALATCVFFSEPWGYETRQIAKSSLMMSPDLTLAKWNWKSMAHKNPNSAQKWNLWRELIPFTETTLSMTCT